ncbi:MAG: PIG-L family deacetylase [Polyangiales bacterium]
MVRSGLSLIALFSALVACSPPVAPMADASLPDASAAVVDALAARRVLWIGAHPDDESTAAPLLAAACLDGLAQCTALVATRGEGGSCAIANGCAPDLGTVRVREMQRAAAVLSATVVQWDLSDSAANTPSAVLAEWTQQAGSEAALRDRMVRAIDQSDPDVILTFDPRHGTTCHPAHRAISALVFAALDSVRRRPTVLVIESTFAESAAGPTIGVVPVVATDPRVLAYDATSLVRARSKSAWSVLLDVLAAHESQFPPVKIAAFAAAPPAQQRVYLLPGALVLTAPDAPEFNLCPR